MNGLVEFLRARLAKEEQAAKLVRQPYRLYISDEGRLAEPLTNDEGDYVQWADGDDRMPNHINNWELVYDRARVLREVEAKRRIVDTYAAQLAERERLRVLHDAEVAKGDELAPAVAQMAGTVIGLNAWINPLGWALRVLASAYADHPDYRPEWKP